MNVTFSDPQKLQSIDQSPKVELGPKTFAGGGEFDHNTYLQNIEMARANFVQALHSYWEKAAKDNRVIKRLKPAALVLFKEENGVKADPYTLVCAHEPPKSAKGYAVLEYEIVPVWTLYLSRAAALLEILETGIGPP